MLAIIYSPREFFLISTDLFSLEKNLCFRVTSSHIFRLRILTLTPFPRCDAAESTHCVLQEAARYSATL